MKIDLEKLHDVALRDDHNREDEKIFYSCHLVAGAIELKNKEVIVWLPALKQRKHIKSMLKKVLEDHDINISSKPNRSCWISENGSRIIFATGKFDGYYNESAIVQFD